MYRHAGAIAIALSAVLAAQQTAGPQEVRVSAWNYVPSPPVIRVDTNLVDVGVVVRDRQGRAVAGLMKKDFRVYDNGKEREITAFSVDQSRASSPIQRTPGAAATAPEAQQPARPVRYLALVFDDTSMKESDLMHVRVAAKRFVQDALQPEDRVAIFTTYKGKLLDFTADKPELLDIIEKLAAHQRMPENGLMPCPRITPYQAFLIVNQDPAAIDTALEQASGCFSYTPEHRDILMRTIRVQAEQTWDQAKTISQETLDALQRVVDQLAEMPGNRVLLLSSSGFLADTLEYEQNRLIDSALRSGVVINALDAKGLYGESAVLTQEQTHGLVTLPLRTMVFEASRKGQQLQTMIAPIAYMAQSTGGLFFHDSNDLASGLQLLGAVPEVTYRLGFRPDDAADKRYHKLQVKLAAKSSDIVQARPGYVAAAIATLPQEQPRQESQQRKLDQLLMSEDASSNIPVSVKTEPGTSQDGQPLIWLLFHVDLKNLKFAKQNERQEQRIIFLACLLNSKGALITGKEGRMDLDLSAATFARLSETGINARLALEAQPGPYRLRTIVEEGVEGKLAASSQAVEIR